MSAIHVPGFRLLPVRLPGGIMIRMPESLAALGPVWPGRNTAASTWFFQSASPPPTASLVRVPGSAPGLNHDSNWSPDVLVFSLRVPGPGGRDLPGRRQPTFDDSLLQDAPASKSQAGTQSGLGPLRVVGPGRHVYNGSQEHVKANTLRCHGWQSSPERQSPAPYH